MIFKNRQEGGIKLAEKLHKFKNNPEAIILALPRGGVVTGFEVARELKLPLDLVVPRKIGAPDNQEFALGAITETGEAIFDQETLAFYQDYDEYIKSEISKQKNEAQRRIKKYRGNRPPLVLKNKIVILVDDGIATGSTMLAAIKSAKDKNAKKIIVAVPVTSRSALEKISRLVDEVVYLSAPWIFEAVGAFYEIFAQTEDEEVIELMEESKKF